MASKQLTNTGVQLGDETHPLNSTSSEIIQKNPILYSLLTMSDEEFNTEYRSRENDAAANFKAQSSQHSSNESTSSTSTKTLNKRKAMANFDDQSIKRHKDSRNAKLDAITTQNKKTDFVDEYLKKQQLIKSSHGKAQIRINNLKKVLLMLKSEESTIDNSSQNSFLGHATTHISKVIESISSELQSSGEIDSCRVCKNEDNPPTIISKTCGHGFCCMNCIVKYFEYVYNKNSGQLICLKCRHPYDKNATCQLGACYGIIG